MENYITIKPISVELFVGHFIFDALVFKYPLMPLIEINKI